MCDQGQLIKKCTICVRCTDRLAPNSTWCNSSTWCSTRSTSSLFKPKFDNFIQPFFRNIFVIPLVLAHTHFRKVVEMKRESRLTWDYAVYSLMKIGLHKKTRHSIIELIEYCKLGVVSTRQRGDRVAEQRERKRTLLDPLVQIFSFEKLFPHTLITIYYRSFVCLKCYFNCFLLGMIVGVAGRPSQ